MAKKRISAVENETPKTYTVWRNGEDLIGSGLSKKDAEIFLSEVTAAYPENHYVAIETRK